MFNRRLFRRRENNCNVNFIYAPRKEVWLVLVANEDWFRKLLQCEFIHAPRKDVVPGKNFRSSLVGVLTNHFLSFLNPPCWSVVTPTTEREA